MRALVADDDPVSRHLFRAALSGLGVEVTETTDGQEAWHVLCGREAPPMALLDWNMPAIDGLELCRRLRARPHGPYVYAMLITARGGPGDVAAGFAAGADDFITKPVESVELAARVQAARRLLDLHADLEQSRSYLATVIEHLDHGAMLADRDGRIVYGNPALARILGVPLARAIGAARVDRLRDQAGRLSDGEGFLQAALAPDGVRQQLEIEVADPDRPDPRVYRWSSLPVPLPGGTGRMDLFQDITREIEERRAQEQLARLDHLTELANRRGFTESAEREVSRARRSGAPLTVVVVDVDHFKRVNDVHGHGVGDQVLRHVADCLAETARRSDVIARWGGEELIALLPDTNLDGGRRFAERMRASLARAVTDLPRVTVSAGVAEHRADEDIEDAIRRADERLYAAKAAGRDAVR
ncbi:MAG TPA: diguanylate cyclase [Kofleriaceae bacterium]|nr:diguanylate cyclase [Kofleriaceae bacterium]